MLRDKTEFYKDEVEEVNAKTSDEDKEDYLRNDKIHKYPQNSLGDQVTPKSENLSHWVQNKSHTPVKCARSCLNLKMIY